jgi:hypothetical protein
MVLHDFMENYFVKLNLHLQEQILINKHWRTCRRTFN